MFFFGSLRALKMTVSTVNKTLQDAGLHHQLNLFATARFVFKRMNLNAVWRAVWLIRRSTSGRTNLW